MESRALNTPRRKFGIASVTKQFTAVPVLRQVAEDMKTRTTEYLPWYQERCRRAHDCRAATGSLRAK